MRNFEYRKAFTLEEALACLSRYGGRAKILAGGTDLLVQMKQSLQEPEIVIDIKGIPGLDEIRYDETGGLVIGALSSIRSIMSSQVVCEKFGVIAEAAGVLGSFQIRKLKSR